MSNPNGLMWPTLATFMHEWLKKGLYEFQMTEEIAPLNGFDHQNKVKV